MAPFVAGRMVGTSRSAAADAALRAIRHLPNEDRTPSIRAKVTTARHDSRIGIAANDNRPALERPRTAGVDMALIVAGRLLLGARSIGFIAAGALLLGIGQVAPLGRDRRSAAQTALPTRWPMPAVTAIAAAPQNATRAVARGMAAPPALAPSAPSTARKSSEAPETA